MYMHLPCLLPHMPLSIPRVHRLLPTLWLILLLPLVVAPALTCSTAASLTPFAGTAIGLASLLLVACSGGACMAA